MEAPRSLSAQLGVVVVVGSANFSEVAHSANIEASVVVRDARFARSLSQQFEGLVARQKLERVI